MSVRVEERRAPAGHGFASLMNRLGSAQKSAVGVPAYMRYVNRRAGGVLAVVSYLLGLSPAQVTGISAGMSFAAIATTALVAPSPLVASLVSAALLLGFAFDSADGQLARLQGGGSPAGEWLDHVVDAIRSSSLHAAVAISLYRFAGLDHAVLLLPLAFGIISLTHYFAMMLRDQLRRQVAGIGARPMHDPSPASAIRAMALLPLDYGSLCLAFLFLSHPRIFVSLYGVLLAFTAAFAVYSLSKAYRELSRG